MLIFMLVTLRTSPQFYFIFCTVFYQYRRGQGFESHTSLNQAFFSQLQQLCI